MNIWAHRGCSLRYPENTLTAFEKAAELFDRGLMGIELDIQLTHDGEIMVIHDERIDRTTDGFGFVRDFSLRELRTFHIHTGTESAERIPTMQEVLDLLKPYMERGLLLNIELKNGVYPYPGMEEKIITMIGERGLEGQVVYSSFYTRSLERVHGLRPDAKIGVLDSRISDCLYKAKGLGFEAALHPSGWATDMTINELLANFKQPPTVRAWFGGHLYPEKPTDGRMDLSALEAKGVTDVFLNEPEKYL